MQTTFSLTAFFRSLLPSSRSAAGPEASPTTERSAREVPAHDMGARSGGSAFYCCYGVRQKAQAGEDDVVSDDSSRALMFMPDLDEGIQMQEGFLQPDGAGSVAWHQRDVRWALAFPAGRGRPEAPDRDAGVRGDRKSPAPDTASAQTSDASPPEPVSRGRTVPSEHTLLTAQGLADQVRDILNAGGSEAAKRKNLSGLLQSVSHDPQLVECLVLNVLASKDFKDAQKVFFIAHVARHHIDNGLTQPPRQLSREAVLSITQSLRDHRAQWRDKTSYGQAFSHFYEGARYVLQAQDLHSEKTFLQDADFVASLKTQSGGFRRWAIDKLDELLRAHPG